MLKPVFKHEQTERRKNAATNGTIQEYLNSALRMYIAENIRSIYIIKNANIAHPESH